MRGISKHNQSQISLGSEERYEQSPFTTRKKAIFVNMSRKIDETNKMRALEHLMPFNGD